MKNDPWHYPRIELATQIVSMFESGLSSSFIFFAPRRMGKTEFLRKDILPVAETKSWNVFYFSFLDAADDPAGKFSLALAQFINNRGIISSVKNAVKKIKKISAGVGKVNVGLEFDNTTNALTDIKDLLEMLTKSDKTLLLMDEVQVLANSSKNDIFVAGFRTALDMYKDNLKVIFTGSSQAGLRKMFSQAKAPFFHFGQNFAFPELDKGFIEHLSRVFKTVTSRKIDTEKLWEAFVEMNKVPLLIRSLVERIALNPNLTMDEAKDELNAEVFGNREFSEQWGSYTALEQLLLKEICSGREFIFAVETRKKFAARLSLQELSVSTLQGAIKKLIRKGIIDKLEDRAGYFIDDPNFKNWLIHFNNSEI